MTHNPLWTTQPVTQSSKKLPNWVTQSFSRENINTVLNDKTYSIITEGGSELLRGMWNRTKNSGIMGGSVSMEGYDANAMQENGQWVRAVELPVSKELVAGSNLFPFVKQQGHWSSLHCIAARTQTLNRCPH